MNRHLYADLAVALSLVTMGAMLAALLGAWWLW